MPFSFSLDLSLPAALYCIAVIFLAAVARGFTGFGFALLAVPLLSVVIAPGQAVTIAILMQLAIGLPECISLRGDLDGPALVAMSVGALFGTPIGIALLAGLDASIVRLIIGGIVCLSLPVLCGRPRIVLVAGAPTAGTAGFLAGLSSGLAAMPGPPALAYFLMSGAAPRKTRATLLIFFSLTSLMALPGLAYAGVIDGAGLSLSAVGLPVFILGTACGTRLFSAARDSSYRTAAIVLVAVTAVVTTSGGLMQLLAG